MYMGYPKSFSARSIVASTPPATTTVAKPKAPPVEVTTTVKPPTSTKSTVTVTSHPSTTTTTTTSHPTTPPPTTPATPTFAPTSTPTTTPLPPAGTNNVDSNGGGINDGGLDLPPPTFTESEPSEVTAAVPVNHGFSAGDPTITSLSIPPQAMDAAGGLPLKTDDSISTSAPIGTTVPFKPDAHGTHTYTTPVVVAVDDGTTILSVTKTMAASSKATPTSGGPRSATSGGFSAWIIAAIIGGVACLAAIAIGVIMYRKWRRKQNSRFHMLLDPPSETVHSVLQLSSSEQPSASSFSSYPNDKSTLPTILEEEEDIGVAHLTMMEEWSSRTSHRRSLSVGSGEACAPPSYRS